MNTRVHKWISGLASFVIMVSLFVFAFSSKAFALGPQFINYQSRLLDASDNAVTSAKTMQFSIYTHASNGSPSDSASSGGPLLWTESYDQASGACAQVDPDDDGYFAVQLGTCSSFPSYLDFTDSALYLGVKIGTDSEATPRSQLGSVPHALNADALGGIGSDAFLRSDASDAFTTGTLSFYDSVKLAFGTSDDFTILHDATDTLFDNTFATGKTIFQLGTDTTATAFDVVNDSGSSLFTVTGSGAITTVGRIDTAVHANNVGFNLPTNAGTPSAVTGTEEGDIVYDTTNDLLYIYDGAAFSAIGGGATLAEVLTNGNTSGANDIVIADNQKLFVGTGSDASLYYDGTDMYFNSQELGSGNFLFQNGSLGINTTGPDRRVDILDASDPQLRLTYTDGSVYTDFETDSSGYLNVSPSGSLITLDAGLNVGSVYQNAGAGDVNIADQLRVGINDAAYLYIAQDTINASGNLILQNNSYNLGVGTSSPDGKFHVFTSSAGSVTSHASGDDLTIENSSDGGLSILGGTSSTGSIMFGDGSSNFRGALRYSHSSDSMSFTTAGTQQGVLTNAGYLGIGTSGPDRKLDILDASNPQLRLTYTDGSVYTDFETDSSGYLNITPSGSKAYLDNTLTINNATQAGRGLVIRSTTDSLLNLYYSSSYGAMMRAPEGGTQAINIELTTSTVQSRAFHVRAQNYTSYFMVGGDGNVGVGTTGPDARFDVLDASNPQLRLTYTDGSVYTDFETDSSGYLNVSPSGSLAVFAGSIHPSSDNTYELGEVQNYEWSSIAVRDVSGNNRRFRLNESSSVVQLQDHPTIGAGVKIIHRGSTVAQFGDGSGTAYLGVGTTGPDRRVDILDASDPQLRLTYTDGSVYTDLQTTSSGYLYINPSGGRVGIGTDSPISPFQVITPTSATGITVDAEATLTDYTALRWGTTPKFFSKQGGNLFIRMSEGITFVDGLFGKIRIDTSGKLGVGNASPNVRLESLDTSAAQLRLTYTAGSVYTDFQTDSSGYLSIAPSGGRVGIGTASPDYLFELEGSNADYLQRIFNDGNTANNSGLLIQAGLDDSSAAGPSTLIAFRDGDGDAIGSITFGSSATAYNTTSDRRLKDNIVDTALSLDVLRNIQIRDYTWKADDSGRLSHGVIAQELFEVYPDAVTQPQSQEDFWMVDYSKLTPLLVKSVQDIDTKVSGIDQAIQLEDATDQSIGQAVYDLGLEFDDFNTEILDFINTSLSTLEDMYEDQALEIAELNSSLATLDTDLEDMNDVIDILLEDLETLQENQTFVFAEDDEDLGILTGFNYRIWTSLEGFIFKAKVRFEDGVEFVSNVFFRGNITLNQNTAGSFMLPEGETKARIWFSSAFDSEPILNLTPVGALVGNYYIDELDTESFVVVLDQVQDNDVRFNWTAFMSEGDGDLQVDYLKQFSPSSASEDQEDAVVIEGGGGSEDTEEIPEEVIEEEIIDEEIITEDAGEELVTEEEEVIEETPKEVIEEEIIEDVEPVEEETFEEDLEPEVVEEEISE